jgi:hypothetical protein
MTAMRTMAITTIVDQMENRPIVVATIVLSSENANAIRELLTVGVQTSRQPS